MPDLEFSVEKNWKKFQEESPWALFVRSTAHDESGQKYIRNALRPSSQIYKVVKSNGKTEELQCNTCGSEIMGATVAHPIHDGPFPLSGSGQCHYEEVPYCPKCEQKPNYHGSFITP